MVEARAIQDVVAALRSQSSLLLQQKDMHWARGRVSGAAMEHWSLWGAGSEAGLSLRGKACRGSPGGGGAGGVVGLGGPGVEQETAPDSE